MIDLCVDRTLFGTETLSFSLPANDPRMSYLRDDIELDFETTKYCVTDVFDDRDRDGMAFKRIEADAIWVRLGKIKKPGSFILDNVSAKDGLFAILDGTAWNFSFVDVAGTFSLESTDSTVLDLLWQWAKVCTSEIQFDTMSKTVNFIPQIGIVRPVSFRYRKNMLEVSKHVTPPEATRIYAYGRDDINITTHTGGNEYVEDYTYYTTELGLTLPEAQERYRKDEIYKDDSFVDSGNLYTATLARLAVLSRPAIVYKCDVIDLSRLSGYEEGSFDLGDYAYVYDEEFGVNGTARVARHVRYPYEPERDKVHLSFGAVLLPATGSSDSRAGSGDQWDQFLGPVTSSFQIRNDAVFTIARIPVSFRSGGKIDLYLDVSAVGVGSGLAIFQLFEGQNLEVIRTLEVPYSDGNLCRAFLTLARDSQSGAQDYRIRVTTEATGGADPANGLNFTKDIDNEASFYVMAQGASKRTPIELNSMTFNFTGAMQTFTVPDNVFEITVIGRGSVGGSNNNGDQGGAGVEITAKYNVIPGQILDIEVGGSILGGDIGWPNGGRGNTSSGGGRSGSGGGSTAVRYQGASFTDSWFVAPGGGGVGERRAAGSKPPGGDAGFYVGGDGQGNAYSGPDNAGGATQFSGGIAGMSVVFTGTYIGNPGVFGVGGDTRFGSGGGFQAMGGGGGGGWYGGGGAGSAPGSGTSSGGGGAGSGMITNVNPALDISIVDATWMSTGQVVISWETPA